MGFAGILSFGKLEMRQVFVFAGFVLFLLSAAIPAQAQISRKPSSAEEVAFTFYKLSNTKPDFKRWVDEMPVPAEVSVAAKPAYKRAMLRRLRTMYENHDPEKFLTIRAGAAVVMRRPPKDIVFVAPEDAYIPGFDISLSDTPKAPYFPYPVADQWVTIIVKDLEEALSVDMTEEQVEKLKPGFGLYKNMHKKSVTLFLTLKPLSADASAPLRMNGIDQWLLMSEIVNISLWNEDDELIWQKQDKNYTPPVQKEIENLFRE